MHGRPEEQPPDPRKNRIPHVPAQERHPFGTGLSREAVADDEVAAALQCLPERIEGAQVVLAIAVPQNDEAAARGGDATDDGVSVASSRLLDHPRARRLGKRRRTVPTPVVHYDDFAGDGAPVQESPGLADTVGDGTLLVAAEDENGQQRVIRHPVRRRRHDPAVVTLRLRTLHYFALASVTDRVRMQEEAEMILCQPSS